MLMICWHIVKWFHVLLTNNINSIRQVLLFNTSNLHTAVWLQINNNNNNK